MNNPLRHAALTISDDQNTVDASGHKYVAKDVGNPGQCASKDRSERCVFIDGFSCAMVRHQTPAVCGNSRKDGRSIIFVTY